jgi:hypothetical protein
MKDALLYCVVTGRASVFTGPDLPAVLIAYWHSRSTQQLA